MLNPSRVHDADRTDLELAFIELQDDAIDPMRARRTEGVTIPAFNLPTSA